MYARCHDGEAPEVGNLGQALREESTGLSPAVVRQDRAALSPGEPLTARGRCSGGPGAQTPLGQPRRREDSRRAQRPRLWGAGALGGSPYPPGQKSGFSALCGGRVSLCMPQKGENSDLGGCRIQALFSCHSTDVFICTSPIRMYKYCPYEKVKGKVWGGLCIPAPFPTQSSPSTPPGPFCPSMTNLV